MGHLGETAKALHTKSSLGFRAQTDGSAVSQFRGGCSPCSVQTVSTIKLTNAAGCKSHLMFSREIYLPIEGATFGVSNSSCVGDPNPNCGGTVCDRLTVQTGNVNECYNTPNAGQANHRTSFHVSMHTPQDPFPPQPFAHLRAHNQIRVLPGCCVHLCLSLPCAVQEYTIVCRSPVVGRYVYVMLPGYRRTLTFKELEVNPSESGTPVTTTTMAPGTSPVLPIGTYN